LIQNDSAREHIPEDLKAKVEAALKKAFSTEALCLAEVRQSGRALRYVPENFKTGAVCLAAVQQARAGALEFVPEHLKTAELCFEALKQHTGYYRGSDPYQLVPEGLRDEVRGKVDAYRAECSGA